MGRIPVKVTAVRKDEVVLRGPYGSYMTMHREDITSLIMKLEIVKDLPASAFEGVKVDGSCIVEKIV